MSGNRYGATRRQFLKAIGASAAAAPIAQLLSHTVARADTGMGPQRFIALYHPHGAASPFFRMQTGETETQYDLSYADCVLSPFDDAATYGRSFKDRLIPIEGVDLASAVKGGSEGHSAPSSILTGWSGTPRGPSIDQFLAVDRGLGMSTPLTSLILAVGSGGTSNDECISFSSNGAPLSKIAQPQRTFDVAFASVLAQQDPNALAALQSQQRSKRSVLDFIKGDTARLSARLSGSERAKLDQHLSAIRELEKAVDALTQMTTGGAACVLPARPSAFDSYLSYNGGEPFFEAITNLQIDLLAQAMACDVTRFASLWMADLSRGAAAPAGLPDLPDDVHSDVAHTYDGPRGSHYGDGGAPGNPATWRKLGEQNRYSYGKAARLLQRLNEHGILDQTVLFMSSDMGDPAAHTSKNVPILLAGGGAPSWRMGRRIKVRDDCPPDRWYCDMPTLVPHNQILVSIAQAFGLTDVTTFGNPELGSGGLPTLG
ncbi:MAG: DUF1552 domain-containing protein [Myxococcota bacterium]